MESPVRPVKPACRENAEQTLDAANAAAGAQGSVPPAAPTSPSQFAHQPFAHKPPKPIGPEAMRALREAIRSGTYPSEDVVRRGLERLIRRPE